MQTQKNLITLHGGLLNNVAIEDVGQPEIRVNVATRYETAPLGLRPAEGAKFGYAIYEFDGFNEARQNAFFLCNVWQGTYKKGDSVHGT